MEKREWLEKEYLVSAEEMKEYDKNTIEYFGVPSLVLMERAALAAAEEIGGFLFGRKEGKMQQGDGRANKNYR